MEKKMYQVKISHDELIELLANYDKDVYPNIKENDRIEAVKINYSDEIIITIGQEE